MVDDDSDPGRGMRVLIVDDDDVVLEVFADMVAALGADVTTATSVAEARPMLTTFRPTLVITDVYMPGENGLVMRAEVRHWNPSVPVVALTGAGDAEVQPDAGFAHVLRKPVVLDTLAAILKTVPR
ncbi:MAG: response regulator [Candidatus Rokubacteria bacterium]|nr:response regulator [Candidatus Rokubacteria bacterium]